jgi:hypothetical protein
MVAVAKCLDEGKFSLRAAITGRLPYHGVQDMLTSMAQPKAQAEQKITIQPPMR